MAEKQKNKQPVMKQYKAPKMNWAINREKVSKGAPAAKVV